MKCFKRTLAYDLKHGIWEKKGGYFVTALLAVFLFTDYSIKLRNYYGNGMAGNPDVTMADYLLYFFSGRYPYMEGEQVFLIPITWLLIFFVFFAAGSQLPHAKPVRPWNTGFDSHQGQEAMVAV